MIDNSKEYIACNAIHYDNGKHYHFMEGTIRLLFWKFVKCSYLG